MTDRSSDSPPELGELLVEWNRRLYEDGHDDIETAGPDGPLWDGVTNGGDRQRMFSTEVGHELNRDDAYRLLMAVLGAQEEAREALYTPATWRGLPPRARRWWALQALAGLSYTRATRLAGVSRREARHWRAVIVARIESRRRVEPDDE